MADDQLTGGESALPDQARAVVIGGGVLGCSVAYHLTAAGWRDVVLLERAELSAGTTWASSALITHFCASPLIARLHIETIALYRELEGATGQSTGLHTPGSLRLAEQPDRVTEYKRYQALARHLGVPFEIVGPNEIRRRHPLLETRGVLAAAWTPDDGYVDPSSCAQALAQAARTGGARILRGTAVRGIERTAGGDWLVQTAGGDIRCQAVVNAAGMWAPEIGRLVGARHPVVAMERQYFVTEDIPALAALGAELPVLRDPEGTFYARQEVGGLLIGPYERQPLFWGLDGIPEGFAHQSLAPFLDRATEPVEAAMARLPTIGGVGIRSMVNVPTSRTPDANPLVGPVRGLPGYYVAAGFFGGISECSVARYLAQWIVGGEPGIDLSAMDPGRFEPEMTQPLALARIRPRHIIGLVQAIGYPHEEPAGGRRAKASPAYSRLEARGAVFGLREGWECPLWFAPAGVAAQDVPSFERANWFPHVGDECRSLRAGAGLVDRTGIARLEVEGPEAATLLDRLSAAPLPTPGRAGLAPMLTPKGRLAVLAEILRPAPDTFELVAEPGAGIALRSWLDGRPSAEDITATRGTLLLVGPAAGTILAALGIDPARWQPGGIAATTIGHAAVRLRRGTLASLEAWEISHAIESHRPLHEALHEAGAAHGLIDAGLRALESLRLESGEPAWGLGIGAMAEPVAVGLGDFIDFEKGDFIGYDSVSREPTRRLACLTVETEKADACGAEPVWHGGERVGLTACGGYGHTAALSLAVVLLPRTLAVPGTGLEIELYGSRHPATVVARPLAVA